MHLIGLLVIILVISGCRGDADPPARGDRDRDHRSEDRHGAEKRPAKEPDEAESPRSGSIEELASLGYVSEGHEALTDAVGVTLNDPRASQGTNLLVSAHDFEVVLIDMAGEVLRTWTLRQQDRPKSHSVSFRRAWVLPDGDLLGVVEGSDLIRMSPGGRAVWSSRLTHHHDVDIVGEELHTLSREVRHLDSFRSKPTMEDRITVLNMDGEVLRQTSVLKSLLRSPYTDLIKEAREGEIDLLHTNSVRLLDGRVAHLNPAFARGNYLVSCRRLSAVMVIDPAREEVIWAQKGPWRGQHDARIVDDSQLMVFDNHGKDESSVRIFDLATMQETWRWAAGVGIDFNTHCCGTSNRLAGGNVLMVLTDNGAAYEVTPGGERVWEYHTPHRTGVDDRRVVRLWDVVRMPPVEQLPWWPAVGPDRVRPR